MKRMVHKGFTLVEILIVVVILGILAAIVIPQFANASNDALKGTLQTQLQTISSQIELYRVRENGVLPAISADTIAGNFGWDALVAGDYLREPPRNGYTKDATVVDGLEAAAIAETSASTSGWYYDVTGGTGQVWAAGFDGDLNLLEHE